MFCKLIRAAFCSAAVVCFFSPAIVWAATADFFVSPKGNDAWSGRSAEPNTARSDGPVATISRAQQLVRELKKQEPNRQRPIVVAIRGGTFYLSQPLVFKPEDSGTASAPVVYQAFEGERPVLSGGVPVTGWKTDGTRWQTTLEDVKSGKWNFSQLFVNDQRRVRPRLPKQGYYTIAASVEPKVKGRGDDRFQFTAEEIRKDWANRDDVEVLAFHQWNMSRLKIADVDPQGRVVTFAGATATHGSWGGLTKGHRYLVENVREALSEPGQWYLDRPSGTLTYLPRAGERPEQVAVVAPKLEQLVLFVGDPKQKAWVQHVQLRGLTFSHTNWLLTSGSHAAPQAEVDVSAAIAAVGARQIVIDTCAVRNVGAYAMAFGLGCQHNRVENCEMVDLGAGGVKIGEAGPGLWQGSTWSSGDPEMLVSHHTVRNCLIAHAGRLHPAAVGVWIAHSPHNIILHNEITDLYYTAVSVGWIWGYAPSLCHHNDIGFNHMHLIGQRVLSDMGGVYTLGTSDGTNVHDNRIHDVQSFSYGGWGLYTDEGSTHITMENNLVYRTRTGGFHQHYGKENRIQNNIFAFAEEQQVQRSRTEPHLSFWFERNIVYWTTGPLLGSNWKDNNFTLANNLYWNAAGKPVTFFGNLTLADWQAKRNQDKGSVIADPRFVAPDKDDFRLRPDSPALKLGFKPFNAAKAGRTTPPVLTKDLPPVPRTFE